MKAKHTELEILEQNTFYTFTQCNKRQSKKYLYHLENVSLMHEQFIIINHKQTEKEECNHSQS